MKAEPLVLERTLNAPVASVWDALTNNAKMKKWYFDIADFKPEIGFEFQFYGSKDDTRYLHLCKITELIPEKRLTYTWKYENFPGESAVTFELFEEGAQTRLKLTHTGLESFTTDNPDFAPSSFNAGWTFIIGTSLKDFVEGKNTN
jgi:uncharacterized protein YndB with AHSA1/START domain